jgi:hypothetical protein
VVTLAAAVEVAAVTPVAAVVVVVTPAVVAAADITRVKQQTPDQRWSGVSLE